MTWTLPCGRTIRKAWLRARTVSCGGGPGNTEREAPSQNGLREAFLEKLPVACLSACPHLPVLPLIPPCPNPCFPLSNPPPAICRLPSVHLQTIYLSLCQLKNLFIISWSIAHLSVCLSMAWSLYSSMSPIFHYLPICRLICVAMRILLGASNR